MLGQGTFGVAERLRDPPLTISAWLLILPVVTLEAYAWGLFGSALKRRVLPAAGIALLGAFPLWAVLVAGPPPLFFGVRLLAAGVCWCCRAFLFLGQQPEVALEAVAPHTVDDSRDRLSDLWNDFSATLEMTTSVGDPRRRVLDLWDEIKHAERQRARRRETEDPVSPPLPRAKPRIVAPRERPEAESPQAESPREVLWWLTWQQARGLLPFLAPVAFFIGFFLPADGQVLWPLSRCLSAWPAARRRSGLEQRDLSYQFLSAQHLPLQTIWRFKIAFWFVAALLLALIVDMGAFAGLMGKSFVRRGLLGAEGDMVGFHVGSLCRHGADPLLRHLADLRLRRRSVAGVVLSQEHLRDLGGHAGRGGSGGHVAAVVSLWRHEWLGRLVAATDDAGGELLSDARLGGRAHQGTPAAGGSDRLCLDYSRLDVRELRLSRVGDTGRRGAARHDDVPCVVAGGNQNIAGQEDTAGVLP